VEGVATKRSLIVPALPENSFGIPDRSSLHRKLDVVPWWAGAINRGHRLVLMVTLVMVVIAPTFAEVYAADKCHIVFWVQAMSQNDKFLMMRSERTHAHIEEALTACRFNFRAQVAVLRCVKLKPVKVGAPEQAANVDPSLCCGSKDRPNFTPRAIQPLIAVAAPIRKHEQITLAHGLHNA